MEPVENASGEGDTSGASGASLEMFADLKALFNLLQADVSFVQDALERDRYNGALRRQFVRALFAFIEGVTFGLKAATLKFGTRSQISVVDYMLLLEQVSDLDDKGKPVTKAVFIKLPSNVLFSFAIFSRAAGGSYEVDTSTHKWTTFKAALKVRNRITHPKHASQLEISDDELEQAIETYNWYYGLFLGLLVSIQKSPEKRAALIAEHKDWLPESLVRS